MNNIKSAVITGPTGAIGVALCELLLSKGVAVYAVCRKESSRINNIPKDAKIIYSDISDISSLDKLISDKIDVFFHLAWISPSGKGRYDSITQEKNIRYSLDALHAAKKLGAKVFIGAGSQAQFGKKNTVLTSETSYEPENAYGIAKLCAENLCRIESKGLEIDFYWPKILSVYGPYDGESSMISYTIKSLLNGECPKLTQGNQNWDYLYSADAAEALMLIAQYGNPDSNYIIANGSSYKLKEYVKILRDAIDPNLSLGFGEIKLESAPLELSADISVLQNDTGFVPKTSFEEGIKQTIDYYRGKIDEKD